MSLSKQTLPLTPLLLSLRGALSMTLMASITITLIGCGNDNDKLDLAAAVAPAPAPAEEVVISKAKLIGDPIVTQNFSASELKQAAIAAGITTAAAADPVCGVTVQYVNHTTTGLKNEATNATEAVMLPNGAAKDCQGERPITLYAHGTTPTQSYNFAALNDPKNAAYLNALHIALNFAGRGDIVIAPNYPGYDASTLDYAPYITLKQGEQMLDGLHAGHLALTWLNDKQAGAKQTAAPSISASDKLFITGYSQGGYVAMAAAKALDELGAPATAVSPASGPYAMAAFADSIMSGRAIYSGSVFLPMLTNSYQQQYGTAHPDMVKGVFAAPYTEAGGLFPTNETVYTLFATGKLPPTQLFQASPTGYPNLERLSPPSPEYGFAFGDNNYLFDTAFRAKYVEDMLAHPDTIYPTFLENQASQLPQANFAIRNAFIENDLRGYKPQTPMLLCGGNQDPSVTYDVNSEALARIWQTESTAPFAMVDVDITNQTARSAAGKAAYISTLPTSIDNTMRQTATAIQTTFATDLASMLAAYGDAAYNAEISKGNSMEAATAAGKSAQAAALFTAYHGMVAPYCLNAANAFFDQYR